MNSQPRRSARLSQLYQRESANASISPSPQSSSASSSAFPSPGNDCSYHQDQLQLQLQAQFLNVPSHLNAPLPSPSANEASSFFGHFQTQQNLFQMSQQTQKNAQGALQSHQQHNRLVSEHNQTNQNAQHHNSFSQQQRPDIQSGSISGQPPPDFLAEAAKRAQIACLMRDMGDVTL